MLSFIFKSNEFLLELFLYSCVIYFLRITPWYVFNYKKQANKFSIWYLEFVFCILLWNKISWHTLKYKICVFLKAFCYRRKASVMFFFTFVVAWKKWKYGFNFLFMLIMFFWHICIWEFVFKAECDFYSVSRGRTS